jgi:hypothetical protein
MMEIKEKHERKPFSAEIYSNTMASDRIRFLLQTSRAMSDPPAVHGIWTNP